MRVVSPGTLTDASYLEAREPAYLMAIVSLRRGTASRTRQSDEVFGVALIDLSTGEFTTAEYRGADGLQALADEIAVLRPREIVLPGRIDGGRRALPEIARLQLPVTTAEPWGFEAEGGAPHAARSAQGARPRGLRPRRPHGRRPGRRRPRSRYLRDTQKADLAHVRTVTFKTAADCLIVDPITLKHLEVVTGSEGAAEGIAAPRNRSHGHRRWRGRLLRAWLLRPLCALERIRDRLDAVEELAFRSTDRGKFRETLKSVHDLERLVARAALGTAGPARSRRAAASRSPRCRASGRC